LGHIVVKRLIGNCNEHGKETLEVFGAAIGCNEKEVPSQKELGFPKGA
jgi:hypothetical protein